MQKQKLRSSFSRHHSNPYTRVRIYESGRRGCKEIENDAVFAREHYRLPGPFNEAPYVLVRMLPDAFSRIDERVKHRQLPVHTASSSSSSRVIVHPDPPRTEATRFWSIARGGFLNRSELVEERWYSPPLHPRICIMHERLLARWLFRSVQRSWPDFSDCLEVPRRG